MEFSRLASYIKNSKNFDKVINKMKFLNYGNGKCTAALKIEDCHSNILGELHQGFSATLVDNITSCAIVSKREDFHVAVNIKLKFFKTAQIGDEIIIEGNISKLGKFLVFVDAEIKNKNGEVLVKGEATKCFLGSNLNNKMN